ncbi:MAG: 2'-5' RNA ligase family protein [Planctomycetes bacterium]|nr:2'-5' RNA ligase family protein [Planctomycetota bacterium]
MNIKAVDIAILPPPHVTNLAIEINAELVQNFKSPIALSQNSCLPHISLAMGCIEDQNLPDAESILKEIASQTDLTELVITTISTADFADTPVSSFEIENSAPLQKLHENIMNQMVPHLTNSVKPDMLFDIDIADSTLTWIKNYRKNASFENFYPHITLGYGTAQYDKLPITFKPEKIAICHLGNHCTCREVIFAIDLNP